MNLFQLATRGVDLSKLPDEEAPRQSVAFEPSTNGGKFSVPSDLNDAFEFAAKDFGIDPDVLRAVAYAESRFHPDVVSGKVKSKTGATGLMQFMPKTAQEYGIDPLDPVQSIFGAAAYLRKSLDKFDGDYGKAVASYNAGPNRKDFDAEDWDARMPAETQGYLRTVFTAADQLKSGKAERPLPQGMAPSKAGAGRGSVSPGMTNTQDVQAVGRTQQQPTLPADTSAVGSVGSAINTGLAKGVVKTGAGLGTFLQDPGGAIVSGLTGGAALLDRGVSSALSAVGIPTVPNQQVQRNAQIAAESAQQRRGDRYEAGNPLAVAGRFMEEDSRRVFQELQEQDRTQNPRLIAQQKKLSEAEGFVGNLKAAAQNPIALAGTLSESVFPMAAGVGAGSLVSRLGGSMGAVSATGTASEAGFAALNAREGVYQAVATMPLEKLAQSPRFQEILRSGNSPTDARELLANELADQAPLMTAAGTAGGTLLTNRLFGGDATAKTIAGTERMTGKELGKRVAQDTVEEVIQGVPEDLVQYGTLKQADPTKKLDLAGSAAQNMVGGFAFGVVGHGGAFARDAMTTPTVESQPTTPQAPPTVTPQAPVTPDAAKTQAVDNIAAAIKELEGGTTQTAPVQPGSQAVDAGAAPVAQGPEGANEGSGYAGTAAATGQSESAQSLSQIRQKQEQVRAAMQGAVSPLPADIDTVRLKQEFARMHATAKGGFDPMADVNLQTGANTTGEDVKRLVTQARQAVDAKETAEIQRMLAEDAAAKQEMADAARTTADGVRSDSDRETQQSAVEGLAQRARTRLVDSLVASYAEPTGYFASPLLKEVASQLGVLQQPALSKQEQSRITKLVTRAQAFVAPNLPADKASTPTDIGADNASMEALIKEKQPKPAATGLAAEMAAMKERNQPAASQQAQPQIFTGKSALFDGYGASVGSVEAGDRKQLMVDPNGGYFWGDWRQESQRDVGAVAGGADKDATPASFTSSKEARQAAASTPLQAAQTTPSQPAQQQQAKPRAKPQPLLNDTEAAMLADFERMYQSDVKGEIKTRLGLLPARQDEATAPAEKRKPSELLAAIKRAGGIKSTNAGDLMGGGAMDANRILPGLFKNDGMNLDLLVPFLKERGYLTQADEDSIKDNGGVNKLAEILQAELSGDRAQTVDSTAGYESDDEAAMRSDLDSKAFALGLPMKVTNEMSTERLNGVINRIERKLGKPVNTDFATRKMSRTEAMAERQAILMADRVERARAQYDSDIQAFAEANDRVQERVLDVMTDEDGNIEVIYESTAGEAYDEGRDTREDSGEVGRPVAQGARAGAGNPEADRTEAGAGSEEGLTAYTPAEVTARQSAIAAAESSSKRAEDAASRAEAAAKQASEIAQRSVAAADTFELGGNAEDNLSGQEGLRFSRASDGKAARAALAKIMEEGVTSPDDLHALLRVPGYSKWAKSTIAGDVAGAAALRRELQDAFPGSDWKAPKLIDQGIITIYPDWVGLTSQSLDNLTKLADKYDTPIGVRGGAATKQLVSRLDGFGFELYNGLQERADRMPNVMFGMIRPAGGITATTPLFSQGAKSPRTPISTIRTAITKAYGNLLTRLEGKGLVSLTQTEEEAIAVAAQARADKNGGDVETIKESLRKSVLASEASDIDVKSSADGNLEGFFDPATGKSFLIADNLTAESAPATLMHEVGIHMAADGKLEPLFKRAANLLKMARDNEFIQRVQSRMDEAGETSNEEAAAYIVTEYEKDRTNAPASVGKWVKDFIADVRAWLFNKGVLLKADQLTVADIAAVARANARGMAKSAESADANIKASRSAAQSPLTQQQTPQTPQQQPLSKWRDSTGRFQFAPGAMLYDFIGAKALPLLSYMGLKAASPELRTQLRRMKAEVAKAQEVAAKVATESAKFSEAERAMVSDLVEKTVAAGTIPPDHAVKMAELINTVMGKQTDELVALGMMEKDSADRWRGQYLPRYYESKLLKKDAWTEAMTSMMRRASLMRGIKGKHLKGRGLFESVPVEQQSDYEALGWEVRDSSFNPEKDKTVMMWRDFTSEERANMGEIRDAGFRFVMGYMQTQKDLALGRMYRSIAQDENLSSRTPTDTMTVKVPDTKVKDTAVNVYGELAGRYVSRETLSVLSSQAEAQSDVLAAYRKALGLWKEGKTVLNPVSHLNNVVSNITMAHFAGVSYHRGDKYIAAITDLVKGSAMVKEAKAAGLFSGGFSEAELMQSMPEELKALAGNAESKADKAINTAMQVMTFGLRNKMQNAYGFEDDFFKYLIYKDARSRGTSPDEAIDFAQRYIFTYDDLPKGARIIRDSALPFFSYTYKAVPALLHTALTQPHRFAVPAALTYAAASAAYAIAAGDDDDDWYESIEKYLLDEDFRNKAEAMREDDQKRLPPWMKGYMWTLGGVPRALRVGYDKELDLPVFFDISRMMPGGTLIDVSPNAGGVPLFEGITPSHPLLSIGTAMLGNRDLFTGKDVVDKTDDRWEAAGKRADWMWKQLSPAITIGNYHYERVMNMVAQQTGEFSVVKDYTGVDRMGMPTLPQYGIPQTFGLKIKPVDLDLSEEISRGQNAKLIREIDAEVRALQRLHSKGNVSAQTMEREREKAAEKKQRLREGLTVDGDKR